MVLSLRDCGTWDKFSIAMGFLQNLVEVLAGRNLRLRPVAQIYFFVRNSLIARRIRSDVCKPSRFARASSFFESSGGMRIDLTFILMTLIVPHQVLAISTPTSNL
jgi:hypothetical protein